MHVLWRLAVLGMVAGLGLGAGPAGAAGAACELLAEPPRVVVTGFKFTEGPVWHQGRWLFSDIPADTIYALDAAGQGPAVPFAQPSGWANGSLVDAKGNVWSARHDRTVAMWSSEGKPIRIVATFEGRKLNSPNDLALGPDGALWFTDPTFGIIGFGPEKAEPDQPVRGIYRLTDDALSLMNGDLGQPNGLAFAPDGRTLYVADSKAGAVVRFPVGDDGALGKRARFAAVESADGLRVDGQGRVWVAGKGGLHVFAPDGARVCMIPIEGRHVANLAFGGEAGERVLVTASEHVWLLGLR